MSSKLIKAMLEEWEYFYMVGLSLVIVGVTLIFSDEPVAIFGVGVIFFIIGIILREYNKPIKKK